MTLANASKPIKPEDADFAMAAWRRMLFIRAFEQRCLDLSTATPPVVAGSIHLCAGQEAIPTGAMAALQPQDPVVATYRGHGWALTGRLDPKEIFAEVCHRATGVNGGRAGSALITAPWAGFIGENSIVGAGGPIACGVALAAQARKTGAVVLVSFGDGATSQGALHESLVFAAAYDLPVIFLCENNGWSEMTASPDIIRTDRLAKRANGYGMVGVTIDGADPIAVRDTIAQAAERARSGAGPSFVECRVSRLWGHYNRDIEHYRPKPDRALAEANDPIALLAGRLQQSGIASETALAEARVEVGREMAAIEAEVLKAATPDPAAARTHVVAESEGPLPRAVASSGAGTEINYIGAVNEALRRILAEDASSLVYGEDVGKAGGIFGASRNLQREFGASRVFDTPIAEAAILGSAVGAAMSGMRPVVEIMWGDFLLVALDQIINQAANIRYVTQGRASVPMVIRTQQGATPGSCSQHSQSLEALLFHIPGIRLGLPATPQDAYDMLRVAAGSPDPVMLIEARALYQRKETVFLDKAPDPMGKARLAREGRDLAIVAWGTAVPEALDAAETLAAAGIDAAVLDLRWLSPLDEAAIADLAARCGRVLIVHEANRTGGVGAEIAARIAERHPTVRVRRLGAPDTRIPASPALQAALLPKADAIQAAARTLAAKAG
ncbi:MAG TPA: thiamine pyrophosphate-dependent enzyme [Hypericibacter adhaerens]|jgi:2-oxoisovalerate dehydrogenase E1 component|uniref:2-oxoglutarate dehydrogenase E1 component n=1 Tax=Hypericibacter adhaerens TaxID=2602016 RepID=A0A5J6N656_9PROT|nr:alpha-ketoacid dehydrogenase subunit alpha/beta [Hypericibacter adhaerens]QEX24173.1 2-oxoisovalerate dehydrogenase E1 [Hypericibacter adhaerens]HWA41945.1 thiamine pyrophosphate-dependent enzyme [Hypericibacter adhaerens]